MSVRTKARRKKREREGEEGEEIEEERKEKGRGKEKCSFTSLRVFRPLFGEKTFSNGRNMKNDVIVQLGH